VLKAFLLLKLPREPGHLYTCTRTHSQLASLAEAFEQLIDHDGVLIAMKSTLFGQVLRKLLFNCCLCYLSQLFRGILVYICTLNESGLEMEHRYKNLTFIIITYHHASEFKVYASLVYPTVE